MSVGGSTLPDMTIEALTDAALQGHAAGAGIQSGLCSDERVLADGVRLSMGEPVWRLVPGPGGTNPLVDAVGYAGAAARRRRRPGGQVHEVAAQLA